MRIWRVAREGHTALDGEGARLYGARWSSEGVAIVYAASLLSLSALEYLVHIDVEDRTTWWRWPSTSPTTPVRSC